MSTFGTIEQAVDDLRNGKIIIVADDEDRENEGDFVCAAELVTPEMINFMTLHGRGLICLALTGDRLGGHLVQGHVDGVGTVDRVADRADARLLDLRVPPDVARVTVPLGSITVDGVSLTVNAIPAPGVIQISLIPFTLQHTTLGERAAGDRVHLEADTIGKYVAQLLRDRGDPGAS